MPSVIAPHLAQVHQLCRQFGVQRFDVFGSAAGEGFDPVASDIDFIVEFGADAHADLFNRYFGLNEALAQLFGRKVDLVMAGAMQNPYFIEAVKRTRQPVYASPLAEAA